MRAWAKGFGWISVVGALLLFPPDSGAESLGASRVSLIQGDVQVKIAETGEWAPASVNMPLIEGDELWVPEGSRAAIQTNNGSHIRLGADTALQVLRMDRDSYQFHLAQGDVYVLNRPLRRSTLQFDTPDASIRAFRKSTFRIEVPDGGTDVSVFTGSVLTENISGTTRVCSVIGTG
jgi:ferric-dicitrate binding protein FerR (iron transport regulator)